MAGGGSGAMRKALHRRVLSLVSNTSWGLPAVVVMALVTLLAAVRGVVEVSLIVSGSAQCPHCCHMSTDNIGGVSFAKQLCAPPIDAVYTWVNGSDPAWLEELETYKRLHGIDVEASAGGSGSGSRSGLNATAGEGGGDGNAEGDEDGDDDSAASANRYRDSNELLYSFRSLEKYAPWIRRIHLVTNGQVPSWLDTSNPRINVVTHEEIFANKSHLPVFSSPAIETQLHHIPGLTKKFVYFNDDVFLAADTWPDDFVTSRGQRVYLSWEVPKCNPGCIESWIGDGFCDQACNCSKCAWDAGDCANKTDAAGGTSGSSSTTSTTPGGKGWTAPTYCLSGCPNSWIGDQTCDERCKAPECGYDGTDCGVEVLNEKIPTARVTEWEQVVTFEVADAVHVDFTGVIGGHTSDGDESAVVESPDGVSASNADHGTHDAVRAAVLSTHFGSLVMLLDMDKVPTEPTARWADACGTDSARNATSGGRNGDDSGSGSSVAQGSGGLASLPHVAPSYSDVAAAADFCSRVEVMSMPVWLHLQANHTAIGERNVTLRFVKTPAAPSHESDAGAGDGADAGAAVVDGGSDSGAAVAAGGVEGAGANATLGSAATELGGVDTVAGDDDAEGGAQLGRRLLSWLDPADFDPPAAVAGAAEGAAVGGDGGADAATVAVDGMVAASSGGATARRRRVRMVDGVHEGLVVPATGVWQPTLDGRLGEALPSRHGNADAWDAIVAKDRARKERFMADRPDVRATVSRAWRGALSAAGRVAGLGYSLTEDGSLLTEAEAAAAEAFKDAGTLRGSARSTATTARKLLDTYGDSLVYTNSLISSAFKRAQRKAPAHMPHFIDRDFVSSLQEKFPTQWAATASHRFRDPTDIQYAFAYFYWVMEGGAQSGLDMAVYWARELDTDGDGKLNDNELLTLAAVVHGQPPTPEQVEELRACVAPVEHRQVVRQTEHGEVTTSEALTPHVTLERVMACELATTGLSEHARFEATHTEETLDEVAFEMITDDYNKTKDQLDSIRARKTKFVCVNDDMREAPEALQAMLRDFYLSFFPYPSQFELPAGEVNPYLHIGPLRAELQGRATGKVVAWTVPCAAGVWLAVYALRPVVAAFAAGDGGAHAAGEAAVGSGAAATGGGDGRGGAATRRSGSGDAGSAGDAPTTPVRASSGAAGGGGGGKGTPGSGSSSSAKRKRGRRKAKGGE